ncbi:MAG: alpha/beta hydrolase [Moraxellaceae bacterium]|jgi:acetyl esterase/lipase|nr:alpha/beta hydrolase [Moraxellaceae bacterium]
MRPVPLSRRLAALLCALLPILTAVPTQAAAQPAYRLVEGLRYTPPGWPAALAGDLYLPSREGPLPVVLVVHGGSWRSGDRGSVDAARIARPLAAQGFAVFSVDYRLAPAWRHPAPLEDLQQAVHWLRANADAYGLDREAIGAWGYSAGAHLVALLATSANESLRLRAVVAGGLPADLTKWPDSPLVKTYVGVTAREDLARVADASPVRHVGPATPPFFLYHGKRDTLVEPEQAALFAAALRAQGHCAEEFYLRHFGHVLTALFPGEALERGTAFLKARLVPPVAGTPAPPAAVTCTG